MLIHALAKLFLDRAGQLIDTGFDLLDCFGGLFRQLAHFVGYDRETPPGLARPRGLDSRVQRQHVGFLGDRTDQVSQTGKLARIFGYGIDGAELSLGDFPPRTRIFPETAQHALVVVDLVIPAGDHFARSVADLADFTLQMLILLVHALKAFQQRSGFGLAVFIDPHQVSMQQFAQFTDAAQLVCCGAGYGVRGLQVSVDGLALAGMNGAGFRVRPARPDQNGKQRDPVTSPNPGRLLRQ